MTFRPSDDVLDELQGNQQSPLGQDNIWSQDDWQHIFVNSENFDSGWYVENTEINQVIVDAPSEEVKAPDLSELLKNSEWNFVDKEGDSKDFLQEDQSNTISSVWSESENESDMLNNVENSDFNQQVENEKRNEQTQNIEWSILSQDDYVDSDKMSDTDRSAIVSWVPGAVNSNLDFLVDNNWLDIVKKYKILNRLFFKWWIFIVVSIIWILSWIILQVKAHYTEVQVINDSSIENKNKWIEETSDKLLLPLVESGVKVDVLIPYGAVSLNSKSFNSKSNLISYNWVILPQLASIKYNSDDFVSLEDGNIKNLTRDDIKKLINVLITNDSIYRQTTNLPNVVDTRWIANRFEWWLRDWFNLSCLNNRKFSDFVCDKFLWNFYKYGKYYDLAQYASELFGLVKDLRKEGKDIEPICNMVKEYTLRAGGRSDSLNLLVNVMEYCGEDERIYYKKLVDFIALENSLGPSVASDVFDDPDLNAYKLLSAQQNVYKILDWTALNEDYIKSYLEYVQTLINKDNGTNRYLQPIYKDLLYVFNMDELSQKLMQKWKLSSDIKIKIDQINNWNNVWSASLLSQLTISDVAQTASDFTGIVAEKKTLEEIFAQYYAMTDRLKIRKVDIISDDEIRVQTEVFTDKILSVTNGETLKVTAVLHRQDNVLYVDSIKVANQRKFSDILNIYLSEWDVTFYAMLNYIDEQVWMRYELASEQKEDQPTFCEKLMEREDITVYTCDESSISLYKWDVEYNFILVEWILDSYSISDENLEKVVKEKLDGVLFMRDSTPSLITSIVDFTIESDDDWNIEKKLEIINQFRIHFKIVPDDIHDVEWKSDIFLVDFTLWDFELQGRYDTTTQVLSKIVYRNCERPLEIKNLSLEITSENESQLIEILNNPRVFFANVNPLIYDRYKKLCGWNVSK